MYISKHHYSVELAKLGNNVYYLEPVNLGFTRKISVKTPIDELSNLKVISYSIPWLINLLRFKLRFLYNLIMPFLVKRLLQGLNVNFDIVWCFETNIYSNLHWFKSAFRIFHPVDLLCYKHQLDVAFSADLIVTVSETIISSLSNHKGKVFFINHGLGSDFVDKAKQKLNSKEKNIDNLVNRVKVGFAGNLFRDDLNREFIFKVVTKYPDIKFHFWGPILPSDSNLGAEDNKSNSEFIHFLNCQSNVSLNGIVRGEYLAEALMDCDILLLPLKNSKMYDGSNSHKIIEYLGTGKAIVSHFVSSYRNTKLLEMAIDDNWQNILLTFQDTLVNLKNINSHNRQIERIEFALSNSYLNQIFKIEHLVNQTLETKGF